MDYSDDEDEEDMDEVTALSVNSVRSGLLEKPTRSEGFIYRTIPKYNETEFRSHFRLSRKQFELLLKTLAPLLTRKGSSGRNPPPPDSQLKSVLWILATPECYR